MSRNLDDSRIATIIDALDHAERIGWLDTLASKIVDEWIACPERWALRDHGWTSEGIRAFVVAYLLHCPDNDLDEAVETARETIVFAESEELRERAGVA